MQRINRFNILSVLFALLLTGTVQVGLGQSPGQKRNFRVEGGTAHAIEARRAVGTEAYTPADSLLADSLGVTLWGLDSLRQRERIPAVELARELGDTLAADSLDIPLYQLRTIRQEYLADSVRFREIALNMYFADSLQLSYTEAAGYREQLRVDSLIAAGVILPPDTLAGLGKRKRRKIENQLRWNDPEFVRHNRFFRDSMGISKVTAISLVVPGYGQLYNSQYWKIPVLYGTVGGSTYFMLRENKKYKDYKRQYDDHIWNYGITKRQVVRVDENGNYVVSDLDPIQHNMIKHNTSRQLLLAAAVGSYIYFIGDGAVNYPGAATDIKKATTLSTIFPGAGQVYNQSYWKVPFVLGGFATMAMTIDWNNRGYQRFRLAYNMVARLPAGADPVDEFEGRYAAEDLRKIKNSYRRNRDLCIILTAAVYALNIVDAHVDAHMKAYDISDDLTASFKFSPVLINTNTLTTRSGNTLGLQLSITF